MMPRWVRRTWCKLRGRHVTSYIGPELTAGVDLWLVCYSCGTAEAYNVKTGAEFKRAHRQARFWRDVYLALVWFCAIMLLIWTVTNWSWLMLKAGVR